MGKKWLAIQLVYKITLYLLIMHTLIMNLHTSVFFQRKIGITNTLVSVNSIHTRAVIWADCRLTVVNVSLAAQSSVASCALTQVVEWPGCAGNAAAIVSTGIGIAWIDHDHCSIKVQS